MPWLVRQPLAVADRNLTKFWLVPDRNCNQSGSQSSVWCHQSLRLLKNVEHGVVDWTSRCRRWASLSAWGTSGASLTSATVEAEVSETSILLLLLLMSLMMMIDYAIRWGFALENWQTCCQFILVQKLKRKKTEIEVQLSYNVKYEPWWNWWRLILLIRQTQDFGLRSL